MEEKSRDVLFFSHFVLARLLNFWGGGGGARGKVLAIK